MPTFTPLDSGTYELIVFTDPYDCDAFESFEMDGSLGDVIEWARTVACEGYEIEVWAGDTLVACVDDLNTDVFGYYMAA